MKLLISEIKLLGPEVVASSVAFETLKKSIAKHGLLTPVFVDKRNRLVSGDYRLLACKELGHKSVRARQVEKESDVVVEDLIVKEEGQ